MKTFLLVLFYRAIVAVNTAVIINGIIWLAKRKEKQEKKPNPDFAPPTTKKPPKPPTTGTNAIEPPPKGVSIVTTTENGDDYGETIMLYGRRYRRASIWVSADKRVASMEYIEFPEPKNGVSADEAAKLFSKLSQAAAGLGGNSKLDELKEKIEAMETKPKEHGIYRECRNCVYLRKDENTKSAYRCGRTNFPVFVSETVGMHCGAFEAKPKAEESIKRYEQRMTRICRNCKHFLTTDEEATVGECGLNDEIMFKDETRACFERKPGKCIVRPKPAKPTKIEASCDNCEYSFAKGTKHSGCYTSALGHPCGSFKPIERPKPLGTKTTH